MDENTLLISEIFHSIQGESSLSGKPFHFIRLTGCNLRCSYCDTAYAFHGGKQTTIEDIIKKLSSHPTKNVLITGGEPLIQKNTPKLAQILQEKGYHVSIETHGEASIEKVVPFAKIIMDIKTPGSNVHNRKNTGRFGFENNLPLLKKTDEVKFVITNQEDYHWAKQQVLNLNIPTQEILFSPVLSDSRSYEFSKWLAEQILKDSLQVRFQLQLHKIIWGFEKTGV